jgi:hypothetical protein
MINLILQINPILSQINQVLESRQPSNASTFFLSMYLFFILIFTYWLLSCLKKLELREKGMSLMFDCIRWKEVKHYHLESMRSDHSGHIIFKVRINFPLASEYRAVTIPISYWDEFCSILEQKLPGKRV